MTRSSRWTTDTGRADAAVASPGTDTAYRPGQDGGTAAQTSTPGVAAAPAPTMPRASVYPPRPGRPSLLMAWARSSDAPHGPDHADVCSLCERVRAEMGMVTLAEERQSRREIDALYRATGVR